MEKLFIQVLWKLIWKFLNKLKIGLAYDPNTLLLGKHTKSLSPHITEMLSPVYLLLHYPQEQSYGIILSVHQ